MFISELLTVPPAAVGPTLSNPSFQRSLGQFLMTLTRPGQAADDHKELVRGLFTDLRQAPTQQLFDMLAAQPAFKAFLTS